MKLNSFLFALFFAVTPVTARADVVLPKIFSSNMVLQRELAVPIWGTADAGEDVTVKFAGQVKRTKADVEGKWMVHLDPLVTSNQDKTLLVEGNNRIELSGVLVGEVWLCSGQSNMADSFNSSKNRFIEPEYFGKPEPDPAISLVNSAGLPASSFMTDDFKPPREPIIGRAPKRKLTEAELLRRKKAREAKRAAQQAASGKSSPAEPMTAKDVALITESNGLAPEVTDLSSDDISFAKEQHLADLKQPFIDIAPEDMADGIEVGELGLDSGNKEMILGLAREIAAGQHGEVDSLLIHHDGRLVFESYYRRGRVNYPHYQMSITKSYTALALGRAIGLGHLKMSDLDRPVLDFLKEIDQSRIAAGCETITLNDALNMHSGIRVDKRAVEKLRKSPGVLNGQGQIQAYLEHTAPITSKSKQYKYQSSDPSIVMQVIEAVVPGTAREFINSELIRPLGISNFGWQDDVSGLPKSAAGSSMRSRDMIKFGMLVQSGGWWDGEQLIPARFIEKATSRIYTNPQDTSYGYFWWRHDVDVDGKTYDVKSGRGAGGQFIMMIDELNLILAITSHNKGMGTMLKTAPSDSFRQFDSSHHQFSSGNRQDFQR